MQLKTYINANVELACVELGKQWGHEVIFTPAYHLDLQPIELVWAVMKGSIGRQYKKGNTFEDIERMLKEEFDKMCSDEGGEKKVL